MGSLAAMAKGSKDRYFQQDSKSSCPKGWRDAFPYKGLLSESVYQLIGGLRPAWATAAAAQWKSCSRTASLSRSPARDSRESHAHDIYITKEAPNYTTKL